MRHGLESETPHSSTDGRTAPRGRETNPGGEAVTHRHCAAAGRQWRCGWPMGQATGRQPRVRRLRWAGRSRIGRCAAWPRRRWSKRLLKPFITSPSAISCAQPTRTCGGAGVFSPIARALGRQPSGMRKPSRVRSEFFGITSGARACGGVVKWLSPETKSQICKSWRGRPPDNG